ncbi:hypothetical protein C8Q73DRAFT_791038 [Cubamyces lactineus]|nr:hypothetical protein C8Q73DRAFT_791038 [Cubamyces lactineus]
MPHDFANFVSEPVTLAIIGCSQRGRRYAAFALQEPTFCKVVAIAEPHLKTHQVMTEAHSMDKTLVFESYEHLLKASADTLQATGKRLADAVIITVDAHVACQGSEEQTRTFANGALQLPLVLAALVRRLSL